MGYSQFSVVGGVFLVVAASMILGLMRDSIPYALRRGAQLTLFVMVCAGTVWYASLNVSGFRWPSWQWSVPASAAAPSQQPELPMPPAPQAGSKAAPAYASAPVTTQLRTGTMREVSSEEAARLMAKGRVFRAEQEKAAAQPKE